MRVTVRQKYCFLDKDRPCNDTCAAFRSGVDTAIPCQIIAFVSNPVVSMRLPPKSPLPTAPPRF